jgi:hypothetical protein
MPRLWSLERGFAVPLSVDHAYYSLACALLGSVEGMIPWDLQKCTVDIQQNLPIVTLIILIAFVGPLEFFCQMPVYYYNTSFTRAGSLRFTLVLVTKSSTSYNFELTHWFRFLVGAYCIVLKNILLPSVLL